MRIIGNRIIEKAEKIIEIAKAQEIYAKIESGINPVNLVGEYDAELIDLVDKEISRIENEIKAGIIANPEVLAKDLAKDITSDILNVITVSTDFIKWYNGNPKSPLSFNEFKALIVSENNTL